MTRGEPDLFILDYETTEVRVLGHGIHEYMELHPDVPFERITMMDLKSIIGDTDIDLYNKKDTEMFGSRSMLGAAVIGALSAPFFGPEVPHHRRGTYANKAYARYKYYPMNGKQECARRMAQIEAGQLRVENGVATADEENDLINTGNFYGINTPEETVQA